MIERRTAGGAGTGIDWGAVHQEALDIFVRYLQIPSVNPPGDEAPAARYLGSLIERAGVEVEYIETAPNREIAYARIKAGHPDGAKNALMLCNHTDVVPVEEQFWDVPPFEGLVRDGFVWGRGAVDMKGGGVMQLIAFLLVARSKIPLTRDLIFCAVPDEEAGGQLGMQWLCAHRPELVDVAYEINEGGMGANSYLDQEATLFTIATAEKTACWMRLKAIGTPGHGSRPHRDNSLVHLARAVLRLTDWDRPVTITPETEEYLRRLSAAGLLPSEGLEEQLPAIVEKNAAIKAMFINTVNVTSFHSGMKVNVIPALSEATVDCRLLPGVDPETWRQELIARIDDPRIEVSFHEHGDREYVPQTPWDTELFHLINTVVTDAVEDAVVTPTMTVGGTDNRFLRQRGVPAYGFIPALLSREEAAGFHGNNERLSIENLNMGCELMYEIVRRFCGGRGSSE